MRREAYDWPPDSDIPRRSFGRVIDAEFNLMCLNAARPPPASGRPPDLFRSHDHSRGRAAPVLLASAFDGRRDARHSDARRNGSRGAIGAVILAAIWLRQRL